MADPAPIDFENSPTLVLYTTPELVDHPEKVRRCIHRDLRSPQTAGDMLQYKKEIEELLYTIFPSRCWEEDGQLWKQSISLETLTRQDITKLQIELDKRLEMRQARESGICPIRRELFNECLDEIIRQVVLTVPERGLLLMRIRDEANMSIEAYESLYISAVDFGMHKAIEANEQKELVRKEANNLETETEKLQDKITQLQLKIEHCQQHGAENLANKQKTYAEELEVLKNTNIQLNNQLEGIIQPAKKTY